MLRISPSMGHVLDMNMSLRHLLFLLEYCMVTGYDWWDILLHVQPSMVQNLVEKLHEEYMRQNAALQQVGGWVGGWELWARSQGGHRGLRDSQCHSSGQGGSAWLGSGSDGAGKSLRVFTFTDISGSLPAGNLG